LPQVSVVRKPVFGVVDVAIRSAGIAPADPLNTIFSGSIGRLPTPAT